MSEVLPVKVDVNELATTIIPLLEKVAASAAVGLATVANAWPVNRTFYVYNYIDSANWVSAMKATIAPNQAGNLGASGSVFKVQVGDSATDWFLLEPGKKYVYSGPGEWHVVDDFASFKSVTRADVKKRLAALGDPLSKLLASLPD